MEVPFTKESRSGEQNGYTNVMGRLMLNGMEQVYLDSIFLLISGFIDRVNVQINEQLWSKKHTMYQIRLIRRTSFN